MKRVLWVPIVVFFLVAWLWTGAALAQTSQQGVTSDILRGPYEMVQPEVAPVVADVLRTLYGVSIPLVTLAGDVPRSPYGTSIPLVALTGDVARPGQRVVEMAHSPYGVSMPLVMLTGDVARVKPARAFGVSIPLVVLTGDVARSLYGVSIPLVALTGDVARASSAPPVLVRGEQPLADILRGPYAAPPVAPAVSPLAWLLAAFGLVVLVVALAVDFLHRKREVAHPPAGARPAPHAR